ncbi:MAG: hypothetical protein GX939_06215 [Clostridiaceae bacterium]|jgi:H+/Cl- antiporter ClcA|nr:hypothetical protein [Clostridiaceae bacterium]
MHNRTKVAILSATSNVIWFILTFIWNCFRVTHLEGEELARSWGIYFLILVAGFLVLIALSAILVMTKEKRSGGQGFEEIIDERDRHIEVFVMKVFGLVFFLSFIVVVSLLALGFGLQIFFGGVAFMVLLSDLAIWITYIIAYERGL